MTYFVFRHFFLFIFRVSVGFPLGFPWASLGFLWHASGLTIEVPCVRLVFLLGFPWVSVGLLWHVSGYSLDFPWIFLRVFRVFPLGFHGMFSRHFFQVSLSFFFFWIALGVPLCSFAFLLCSPWIPLGSQLGFSSVVVTCCSFPRVSTTCFWVSLGFRFWVSAACFCSMFLGFHFVLLRIPFSLSMHGIYPASNSIHDTRHNYLTTVPRRMTVTCTQLIASRFNIEVIRSLIRVGIFCPTCVAIRWASRVNKIDVENKRRLQQ